MTAADDLAARAREQAEVALSDVEHLHREDGTRILVAAAASTTLAILALRAELREHKPTVPLPLFDATVDAARHPDSLPHHPV